MYNFSSTSISCSNWSPNYSVLVVLDCVDHEGFLTRRDDVYCGKYNVHGLFVLLAQHDIVLDLGGSGGGFFSVNLG
jgi:hypothetical protein